MQVKKMDYSYTKEEVTRRELVAGVVGEKARDIFEILDLKHKLSDKMILP